jgi:hypothetical protein
MKIDRYELEGTADTLLAQVQAMKASDDTAEKKVSFWGAGCAVSALGLFGSFFMAQLLGPWAAVPIVACVAFGILCLRKMKVHGEMDLEDRKVETLQKVLSVLRADVPAVQPVKVEVDFRDYVKAGQQRAPGSYTQTWLRTATALADGTAVALSLAEDVKRKERRKRKYTKVKERITGEASIELRLARQYGDAAAAAERLRSVPPPPGYRVAGLQGAGRRLHATLRTAPAARLKARGAPLVTGKLPDADTLLVALRWAYRGLAP